jgi:hypothetical protein
MGRQGLLGKATGGELTPLSGTFCGQDLWNQYFARIKADRASTSYLESRFWQK